MTFVDLYQKRLTDWLWSPDTKTAPAWKQTVIWTLRMMAVISRDLTDGQISLRAMSLVYTTLLSLVPFLALSFSVLKAFGVHNQIEPSLAAFLAPLGERGTEITQSIVSFVENISVGVLGSLGLLFLIYTAVALLQKTEASLNAIWHVRTHRHIALRVSGYLSIVVIGPVLMFSAIGITATLMNTWVVESITSVKQVDDLMGLFSSLIPYLFAVTTFTLIYYVVPNARVSFLSAVAGGLVAGILWNVTGWAFASFVITAARYAAVYSALASLVLFMLWLYVGWYIMLLGAKVAFYIQYPEQVTLSQSFLRPGIAQREALGLHMMHAIAKSYADQTAPMSVDRLLARYHVPRNTIEDTLAALLSRGLIVGTSADPTTYVPARPLAKIEVNSVLEAIRGPVESDFNARLVGDRDDPVENVISRVQSARTTELSQLTFADLTKADTLGKQDRS